MEITATPYGKAAGCVATFHITAFTDWLNPRALKTPVSKLKHLSIILKNCRRIKVFFEFILDDQICNIPEKSFDANAAQKTQSKCFNLSTASERLNGNSLPSIIPRLFKLVESFLKKKAKFFRNQSSILLMQIWHDSNSFLFI
ncbi:hypothetical protein [Limosilactobacillus mucosae]|uniref:hypothetical protein n=1 Tax=Limosilactobacillus mucosae TaxID=97478 RepID=UPI0039950661